MLLKQGYKAHIPRSSSGTSWRLRDIHFSHVDGSVSFSHLNFISFVNDKTLIGYDDCEQHYEHLLRNRNFMHLASTGFQKSKNSNSPIFIKLGISDLVNNLTFQSFDNGRIWWSVWQGCVVCIILDIHVIYCVGGQLVHKCIMCPVVSALARCIKYIYIMNLQFLNNVIIIKTEFNLPRTLVSRRIILSCSDLLVF